MNIAIVRNMPSWRREDRRPRARERKKASKPNTTAPRRIAGPGVPAMLTAIPLTDGLRFTPQGVFDTSGYTDLENSKYTVSCTNAPGFHARNGATTAPAVRRLTASSVHPLLLYQSSTKNGNASNTNWFDATASPTSTAEGRRRFLLSDNTASPRNAIAGSALFG